MRHLLSLLLISALLIGLSFGSTLSIDAICEREPSLSFCKVKRQTARSTPLVELPAINIEKETATHPTSPKNGMTSWESRPTESENSAQSKEKVPCKPDCDESAFPHCTTQCKCDYLLPVVQKYCNPPLELFKETCRLWSQGCGKTQQSLVVFPGKDASKQPQQTQQKSKNRQFNMVEDSQFVPPPPIPHHMRRNDPNPVEDIDVLDRVSKRRRAKKRTLDRRERKTPPQNTSPQELKNGLKLFSSFVRSPVQAAKDLIQGKGQRPRAQADPNIPVIPSDASYGAASGDTFKSFDGLTDSRGILHRPRSSSPFTKPGLWSANPDDPHNRDHANKYYYRPSSVGVDWLNGQITWGAHWAVPAAQVGGTDGFSALHFPTIGNFLNIPDDYD